jgi:hypothetical protein
MVGMDKHSGSPARTGSGFPPGFALMGVIVSPSGDDPLDDKA